MGEKSEFYTLNGYKIKNHDLLTESMEDYLEMIYRNGNNITVKNLSDLLNVRPSSVSKMATKLKSLGYISFETYGDISLTDSGINVGKYLLWRHSILENILKYINKDDFCLEQVERIEHFVDDTTLKNIETFLKDNC